MNTLKGNADDFGYVAQLVGYAKASGKEVGGWWVINKVNGQLQVRTCRRSRCR